MQINKSNLNARELAAINKAAESNKAIEQTPTHFLFPLSALPEIKHVRPQVIFHSDSIKNTTVFFDVAGRKAEISSFIFDTAFECGGYYVEFEISEETLIDLCTDLDLFETDGDGGYYTYKEFGSNEFGERESARCYQDLDELANELEPYEQADIFKAYIQQKGLGQVALCRAEALQEETQTANLKEAIEAVIRESGFGLNNDNHGIRTGVASSFKCRPLFSSFKNTPQNEYN